MKRNILAFIIGLAAWVLVVSLLDRALRLGIAGYAQAEPQMAFTFGMKLARLVIAAVTSLIAGAVTGWITRSGIRVAWLLGTCLLALFIPEHVRLWQTFPVWYHLTFLVTLAPLVALGAFLAQARSPDRAAVGAQQ